MSKEPKHIIISRTDAIGDVVLTLPLAYYLKQKFPAAKITWLGRTYTQTVIKTCSYIDNFVNSDEWNLTHTDAVSNVLKALNADAIIHVFPNKHLAKAAKLAGIKIRIGTSHRLYHWLTCNQLVNLGRKNSPLHEAQLNISLARYFGIDVPSLDELKHLPILLDTIEFVPFDFLANEKKAGIFNAVAPNPCTINEIFTALKKHKRTFLTAHAPEFVLKLMLGEMSIEVLKSCKVSSQKIEQTGFSFLYNNIEDCVKSFWAKN